MPEIELSPKERQALKARAHALKPVVLLGAAGLTPPVLKEIDRALLAHELIKVKVPGEDRAARDQVYAAVADALSAGRVQAIGKLLVLYRPAPEPPEEEAQPQPRARATGGRPADAKRSPKAPARPPGLAKSTGRTGKPSAPKRSTPDRRDAERVNRAPAPRRDPGRAQRAPARSSTARRGGGRSR